MATIRAAIQAGAGARKQSASVARRHQLWLVPAGTQAAPRDTGLAANSGATAHAAGLTDRPPRRISLRRARARLCKPVTQPHPS
jgi:hypothetical protein